jgi:hypothetical protein
MLSLSEKQWWVIWAAVGLLLLIWWNGLDDTARANAYASPRYIRETQNATRDYEQGRLPAASYTSLLGGSFTTAYLEAYSRERTMRRVASVVAVAGFGVWWLGARQRK